MPTLTLNPDTGAWETAKPLNYLGWRARLEINLRLLGVPVIPRILAWWDERGLGK